MLHGTVIAQSGYGSTPYLGVSRHIGNIMAACVILIVIAFFIKEVRGSRKAEAGP